MTLFEMIDELEPLIPEAEIKKTKALQSHIWTRDHPEEWRRIVKKRNDKRQKKGEKHERVGTGDS